MTDVALTSFLLSPCLGLHRCLVERGDVAFVKDQTVIQNTDGMCTTLWPHKSGSLAPLCSGYLCGSGRGSCQRPEL